MRKSVNALILQKKNDDVINIMTPLWQISDQSQIKSSFITVPSDFPQAVLEVLYLLVGYFLPYPIRWPYS